MNRLSKVAAFGSEVYSAEELVAEIGAASILATLGISSEKSHRKKYGFLFYRKNSVVPGLSLRD